MPKDKNLAKHKSRFEVRGGVVNEFDFHRNQGELAEQERDRFARQEEERRLRESEAEAATAEPHSEAELIHQSMEEAQEKVADASPRPVRSSGAKGAAKKSAGGKGTAAAAKSTKKGGAKKSAARKTAGKKGAAKKGRASKAQTRTR